MFIYSVILQCARYASKWLMFRNSLTHNFCLDGPCFTAVNQHKVNFCEVFSPLCWQMGVLSTSRVMHDEKADRVSWIPAEILSGTSMCQRSQLRHYLCSYILGSALLMTNWLIIWLSKIVIIIIIYFAICDLVLIYWLFFTPFFSTVFLNKFFLCMYCILRITVI